jgi:hypothetical protein
MSNEKTAVNDDLEKTQQEVAVVYFKILVQHLLRMKITRNFVKITKNQTETRNLHFQSKGKKKVVKSLCLTKHHAMNTYGGVEV